MTYFLLRDYNILPKKELHSSLWVYLQWEPVYHLRTIPSQGLLEAVALYTRASYPRDRRPSGRWVSSLKKRETGRHPRDQNFIFLRPIAKTVKRTPEGSVGLDFVLKGPGNPESPNTQRPKGLMFQSCYTAGLGNPETSF